MPPPCFPAELAQNRVSVVLVVLHISIISPPPSIFAALSVKLLLRTSIEVHIPQKGAASTYCLIVYEFGELSSSKYVMMTAYNPPPNLPLLP